MNLSQCLPMNQLSAASRTPFAVHRRSALRFIGHGATLVELAVKTSIAHRPQLGLLRHVVASTLCSQLIE